jgi:hypothetical protein
MTHRNIDTRRLLPALLLLAGLALLVTSCSRGAASTPPTATTAPAATSAPAPADAATSIPTTQPPAATPSPLPAPDTGASPLPAPDSSTSPLPASGPNAAVIVLQRTGGLAGVSEQWSIFPDGRVLTPKGTQSQVDAAQVSALVTALDQAGFFTLQDSYGKNSPCRDCYNYQLSVNDSGRSKTVSFVEGAGDTPPGLTAALKAINELVALSGS